ncbi:type II toxin-antitoxin system PemK/MazF family toxin [Candidatus Acetothermia bacterium]|nr:type II toxin-antitoxin system PemK/MazF family toxin [Candidatus Acetothermia bacterium]
MPGHFPCRGDIYHVDFGPPIGSHFAVIVAADAINSSDEVVLMAVITSKGLEKIYPNEFKLPEGLLRKPSKVACHRLVIVDKNELTDDSFQNTIPKRDMQGLDSALMMALDLWK